MRRNAAVGERDQRPLSSWPAGACEARRGAAAILPFASAFHPMSHTNVLWKRGRLEHYIHAMHEQLSQLLPPPERQPGSACGRARTVRLLIALTGLGLGAYLVIAYHWKDVLEALQAVGWAGVGAILLLHLLPTLICGLAWWVLLRPHSAESWFTYFWLRWIRGGADGVVPILPLSGELIATRLLNLRGAAFAGAAVIVDVTAELMGQLLFAFLGFALLLATHPAAHHLSWIAVGIAVMTVQAGGFYVAQKKGLFRIIEHPLEWLRRRRRTPESRTERRLHEQILVIHAHQRAFLASVLLHLAGWMVGALEAWIGLRLMGHPLSVAGVLALESLVAAARSVIFFVPLNAGVQEGAYVLLGGLLGLPPGLALAVSLLRRARDLIKGLPALAVWQLIEGRELRRPAAGWLGGNSSVS